VDITELAVMGEQFPLRLMQLGFRLFQVTDEVGRDQYRYVLPPVCEVPAGPFLMGSDPHFDKHARDNEPPQQTIDLPSFQIGTYPVTVAEYACAVQAGRLREPSEINGVFWHDQLQQLDHPVVCLRWHQASAYAAWLAHVTKQPWRLPTEIEWEKAARGTDGRIYPWGQQWDWETKRANAEDTESVGPGGTPTTPVGIYTEQGDASPYGAHDMAGNVSEWTSTLYRDSPPTHHDVYVLRGGSWAWPPPYARTTNRSTNAADTLGPDIGMRLVLSVSDEL